jgi:WD40 repeat protein
MLLIKEFGLEYQCKTLIETACCLLGIVVLLVACKGESLLQKEIDHPEIQTYTMMLSPDGHYLALSTNLGLSLYETDTLTRQWFRRIEKHPPWKLIFSHDEKILSAISAEKSTLWNVDDGQKIRELSWEAQPVDIQFSPDDTMLAMTDGKYTLTIWDSKMSEIIHTLELGFEGFKSGPSEIWSVAWCLDGTTIVTMKVFPEISMIKWNVETGEQLVGHRGYLYTEQLTFNSDGQLLVFDNMQGTTIWDTVTSQKIGTIPSLNGYDAVSFVWSPDGRQLILGLFGGTVIVWDVLENKQAFELVGHTAPPLSMVVPRDTMILISVSQKELIVWDIETYAKLRVLPIPLM